MAIGDQGSTFRIFDDETANTTSTEMVLTSGNQRYILVSGDLGGGDLDIQMALTKDEFVSIDGGAFTELGARLLDGIPQGARLRGVLANSTAANLTVEITK